MRTSLTLTTSYNLPFIILVWEYLTSQTLSNHGGTVLTNLGQIKATYLTVRHQVSREKLNCLLTANSQMRSVFRISVVKSI